MGKEEGQDAHDIDKVCTGIIRSCILLENGYNRWYGDGPCPF